MLQFKKYTGGIILLNSKFISEIEEVELPGKIFYLSVHMNNGNSYAVANTMENIENGLTVHKISED